MSAKIVASFNYVDLKPRLKKNSTLSLLNTLNFKS